MIKKYYLKKPNINIKIISEKINLIPIHKKHINRKYISWLKDKKLNKYIGVRFTKISIVNIVNYINFLRSNKDLECFAIEDKNNVHIGNIFITNINKINKVASYGILIGDAKARLTGYGFFSSLLIIEFLFRKLKVNKIQGSCMSENYLSWRLLERIGFEREGHFKNHSYKSKNSFFDIFVYGMQKINWKNNKKRFHFYLKKIKYLKNKGF